MVSAEDGEYFADYYGEIDGSGLPYINEKLKNIAEKYGTYWEWENPSAIMLAII